MTPFPGSAPPAPSAAGYEFTELENRTIRSTAAYARWWGIISLVIGILIAMTAVVLIGLLGMVGVSSVGANLNLPASKLAVAGAAVAAIGPLGVVYIVCGVLYLRSGAAMQQVVDTEGQDMPLMMASLRALSRAFWVEAVASLVALVGGFVLGVVLAAGGKS
jgi:hypothetical protein